MAEQEDASGIFGWNEPRRQFYPVTRFESDLYIGKTNIAGNTDNSALGIINHTGLKKCEEDNHHKIEANNDKDNRQEVHHNVVSGIVQHRLFNLEICRDKTGTSWFVCVNSH